MARKEIIVITAHSERSMFQMASDYQCNYIKRRILEMVMLVTGIILHLTTKTEQKHSNLVAPPPKKQRGRCFANWKKSDPKNVDADAAQSIDPANINGVGG